MEADQHTKDLEKLHHLDHFLRLCSLIADKRESEIKSLRGAEDGAVREISGRIQAYDDILDTVQWHLIRSRASIL
jgi:hypothetical protein